MPFSVQLAEVGQGLDLGFANACYGPWTLILGRGFAFSFRRHRHLFAARKRPLEISRVTRRLEF